MKVLCKKSYIIHSDGTELFTKGLWYNIYEIIKNSNDKIIGYSIISNYPNIFDEYTFLIDDDYPELEGLSEEALESYINDNAYDMPPTDDYYDSLGNQLMEQDVEREKITGEENEIIIE